MVHILYHKYNPIKEYYLVNQKQHYQNKI